MSKKNLKFDKCRANQSNPNHDSFWQDLGFAKRPDNWKKKYAELKSKFSSRTSSKTRQNRRDLADFWDGLGPLCADDY